MRCKFLCSAFLASAIAVAASLAVTAAGDSNAQETTIDVGSFYFCSATFNNGVCDTLVTPGSTVTWDVSEGTHTVTQCDSSFTTCPPPGGFASSALSSGVTYSQTFKVPGTYSYLCLLHPTAMRGRILVQAQPTATPVSTPSPVPASATPTSQPTQPPASATLTPAAVPSTGGDSGAGFDLLAAVVLVGLGTLSVLAGGAGLLALKRTG